IEIPSAPMEFSSPSFAIVEPPTSPARCSGTDARASLSFFALQLVRASSADAVPGNFQLDDADVASGDDAFSARFGALDSANSVAAVHVRGVEPSCAGMRCFVTVFCV